MLVVRPLSGYTDMLLGINMGNQQWNNKNKETPVYAQIDIYIYIHAVTLTCTHIYTFSHTAHIFSSTPFHLIPIIGFTVLMPVFSSQLYQLFWPGVRILPYSFLP